MGSVKTAQKCRAYGLQKRLGMWSRRLRVEGLRFRDSGLRFRVEGLGFRVLGLGELYFPQKTEANHEA